MIAVTLVTSIVAALLVALAWVLWLILRDAISKEAAAVIPERTRSLIERAKNRLPEEAQPRWEEEWPAGFAEAIEKRPVWALREAISLYKGARKIAAALEPAVASASNRQGIAKQPVGVVKGSTNYAKLMAWIRAWPRTRSLYTKLMTELRAWPGIRSLDISERVVALLANCTHALVNSINALVKTFNRAVMDLLSTLLASVTDPAATRAIGFAVVVGMFLSTVAMLVSVFLGI